MGQEEPLDKGDVADQMKFKLKARVIRSDARTIRRALDQLAAKCSVKKEAEDFIVEGKVEGPAARDLNRALLYALKKVEKKAKLRAEWTSSDHTTERYFDYVLKQTIKKPTRIKEMVSAQKEQAEARSGEIAPSV